MERGESVTNVISLKHPVYGGEIDIIGIYEVGAALDLAVQHYGNNYRDPNSRGEDDGGGEGADIPPQTCNNVYRDDDGNVCGHCLAAYVLSLCGVPDEELERCRIRRRKCCW